MTVTELMFTPLLKNAKVLAGEDGMSANVIWCSVDTAIEFNDWILPGLMFIYTGKVKERTWEEYILEVKRRNGACILLFGDEAEKEIGEDGIAICERENMPLLKLSGAVNVISFMRRAAAALSLDADFEQHMEEWLHDICYSNPMDINEITAEHYGFRYGLKYYCVFFWMQEEPDEDPIILEKDMAKAKAEIYTVTAGISGIILCNEGNNIISFFAFPKEMSHSEVKEKINAYVKFFKNRTAPRKWRVFAGPSTDSPKGFPESFQKAIKTEEFLRLMDIHGRVSYYDDWYYHMLLLSEPKPVLERHMQKTLAPILEKEDLVETLKTYLLEGENQKTTADKLFIHQNTLKYRLARISELLDTDLRDSSARFYLRMAVTIYDYLKNQN